MFEGPSPKHCRVISLFCTRGHYDLDLCPWFHLLVRTNIPSKSEGPSPKHCQVIKLFSIKGPGDLDLCHLDHLLVFSSKFEGPNHKHCSIVSCFSTKGHADLDLWLKGHLFFRSILPISLIVQGLIIANGFLLYVKMWPPPLPPLGKASFHPRGIIWTVLSEDL